MAAAFRVLTILVIIAEDKGRHSGGQAAHDVETKKILDQIVAESLLPGKIKSIRFKGTFRAHYFPLHGLICRDKAIFQVHT